MKHASGQHSSSLDSVDELGQFAEPNNISDGNDDPSSANSAAAAAGVSRRPQNRRSGGWGWQVVGIVAEILVTLGLICGLYVVWQLWWTGVEAEHIQNETRQSVGWSDPTASDSTSIAAAQEGDPPVQPENPQNGDLIAEIYIPRFGNQWVRNIVEGTDAEQLNKHGMGHYPDSQLPGELGNFAVAGHRTGYGQPLGDVDKMQEGDSIVVRTQDYWYVYKYTSYKIVLPEDTYVVAPNPEDPTVAATKRMITLTTCEPKYTAPTHRWIVFGELQYWAKVSDGIPQELSTTDSNGAVKFTNTEEVSAVARLQSLQPLIMMLLIAYVVLFLAAAVAWRWPARRAIRLGQRRKPDLSIYGGLTRLQPGVFPVRLLLMALLLVAGAAALFQWGFPWAASTIPFLRDMSSYVTV
ncbi:class E sortase [Bifidobacterium tsurumiense]|uniref:Sortase family protein n=1 Tax=Bifidobacterium tsurumiense TaxID=356829 RepID=A0A087EKW6_9BIFI|nr:class E sortase [Bifidobacterium tsurumiense]KFJ08417.1 sortase family protein [Bifidobacterium tsurumiense]MDY4678417.1 class E sortase [Bifidobacterium tsurumiense]